MRSSGTGCVCRRRPHADGGRRASGRGGGGWLECRSGICRVRGDPTGPQAGQGAAPAPAPACGHHAALLRPRRRRSGTAAAADPRGVHGAPGGGRPDAVRRGRGPSHVHRRGLLAAVSGRAVRFDHVHAAPQPLPQRADRLACVCVLHGRARLLLRRRPQHERRRSHDGSGPHRHHRAPARGDRPLPQPADACLQLDTARLHARPGHAARAPGPRRGVSGQAAA